MVFRFFIATIIVVSTLFLEAYGQNLKLHSEKNNGDGQSEAKRRDLSVKTSVAVNFSEYLHLYNEVNWKPRKLPFIQGYAYAGISRMKHRWGFTMDAEPLQVPIFGKALRSISEESIVHLTKKDLSFSWRSKDIATGDWKWSGNIQYYSYFGATGRLEADFTGRKGRWKAGCAFSDNKTARLFLRYSK